MLRIGGRMSCRLGSCAADSYRVTIRDRTGVEIVELTDLEQIDWDRRLNDRSEATVSGMVNAECCERLKRVRTWRCDLAIARDGEEVWVGPIRTVPNTVGRVTVKATDVLGWLERRVIHSNHDYTPLPGIGSVALAVELIRDGFAPDDPDVLRFLKSYGVGVMGGWNYVAYSNYVFDTLTELAKGSIDFTAIGRRIVVMPNGYKLGQTPLLTCDNFQGNDLATTEDGDAYVSKAYVTGLGLVGIAGGTDDYYGLVETLVDDQQIGRQTTADGKAAGLVTDAPPLLVQPPNGSSLSPDTPICLSALVPGVTVPVNIDCTCRTASQDMRLTQLKVTVNNSGESISPLLTPVGLDAGA
jgi:hypothetical protein